MTTAECEKIYAEAYRAVYWTALALMKNEADAEDIVQDMFVTLMESYDTIQDKSKVVPWLKKVCANKCLNLLTRTKTEAVEQEFLENLEAVPEDFLPEAVAESQEKRRIIMDIISRALSEEIRRTIILYYFDEMSAKEIAEAMGIPLGTVLWRLSYARMKIKKEVEKYEKDNDIKLYTVAVPFLALLFLKESEQVPLRPMPDSLKTLSASNGAARSEAAKSIVTETIRKGTGIAMKKIIFSCVGLLLVGITIVGIIMKTHDDAPDGSRKEKDSAVLNNDNRDSDADSEGDDNPIDDGSDENPEALPTIDVSAFAWESIYRWEENEIVGLNDPLDEAVRNTGILVIPAKCESIGDKAFYGRTWVKEVRFETPEKVTALGYLAFAGMTQLHYFVMPPNANTFQDGAFLQGGSDTFGTGVQSYEMTTRIYNVVLPNGPVTYYLMQRLGNYGIDSPKNNQLFPERVFVPENFSIRYNDPDWDNHCFAKYTKAYYDANWSQYTSNVCEVFPDKPCKVYVVKGSWADVNFDDWTAGDLIEKEYWDGVNYTFSDWDPLWDIDEIEVNIDGKRTCFGGREKAWRVTSYDEYYKTTYKGYLTEADFMTLYREVTALLAADRFEETTMVDRNYIRFVRYGLKEYNGYVCSDTGVLEELVKKYAK